MTRAPGAKRGSRTSSQWPDGLVLRSSSKAADRVHRDVDATVVVEVGRGEPSSVHVQSLEEAGIDEAAALWHEDLDALCVLLQAR